MHRNLMILACGLSACSHEPAPPTAEAWHFSEPEQSILSQIDAEIFSLEDGVSGATTSEFWAESPKIPDPIVHSTYDFYLYPMDEWLQAKAGSNVPADPALWYVLLPREFFQTPKDIAFQLPPRGDSAPHFKRMAAVYLKSWERGWAHVSIYSFGPQYEIIFRTERPIENPRRCYGLSLFNATTRVELPPMCGEPGDGFDQYHSFVYRRSE
ncbi:MAG: hypothetical protein R3E66_12705 [bacterium]